MKFIYLQFMHTKMQLNGCDFVRALHFKIQLEVENLAESNITLS